MKLKVVWLPGRSISLGTENFVCCNRNAILACYIGLYIIFFITQIYRVRFVSVNGRASRVKPSKNKFRKEVGNKFLEKKICEKIVGKKFWKKILWEKFWKKMLEKSFDKKKFGNINYNRKIFITKIYSNIDKCHTIFALLAPFDKTGRKTGSDENVCGIWSKIGNVARSDWTQVMWRFKRSQEKRYNHGLRAVHNSLTTWAVSASSVVRKKFEFGLASTMKRCSTECHKKVECCASAVVRC